VKNPPNRAARASGSFTRCKTCHIGVRAPLLCLLAHHRLPFPRLRTHRVISPSDLPERCPRAHTIVKHPEPTLLVPPRPHLPLQCGEVLGAYLPAPVLLLSLAKLVGRFVGLRDRPANVPDDYVTREVSVTDL